MRKGQALVEFAVVATLLFTLLFGIIDWGLYFYRLSLFNFITTNSARQASTLYWSNDSKYTNLQQLKDLVTNNSKKIIGLDPSGYLKTAYSSSQGQILVAIENYPYKSIAGFYSRVPKTISTMAIISVIQH